MRRPLMPLLLIALMGVPFVVCAQVYKWKDAHGTVHFADTPPPHGVAYTIVKTRVSVGSGLDAASFRPPRESTVDNNDSSSNSQNPLPDTPINRKQVCEKLEANIKLLNGSSPVITKDASGKSHVMSAEDRSKELAVEQKQHQQFCQ
ncbi:MAG TPA: DUF4124 domain-containing protein [Rhodanobacteraceae bacterium]|nr:DUF4124 domain-containing protein [Rhodanobacteraceae bacterium]